MSEAGHTGPSPSRRQLATVLLATYAAVLLSFALPQIALDGRAADFAVLIADSGGVHQLPWLVAAALVVLLSRPGISLERRLRETATLLVILLVILAGNAWVNEALIKPSFAIPRPNLATLAEQGALGIDVNEFYGLGDKQIRREYLAPRLAELSDPWLSMAVHEHWLEETGYSFPSGHATASMTFSTLALLLGLTSTQGWRRVVLTLLPIWAVLVVLSRPLLRVHTPIDVCFGAAVGIGLGLAGFAVVRSIFPR